ncbi:MAG TPA: DMT family transporter [Tissierellia bacterium]|nr:DMT family transporter [Tissierellia bacterium]
MEKSRVRGEIFLSITAIIWGLSFISQKLGMNHLGPFTFSATRLLLGSIVLVPVFLVLDRLMPEDYDNKHILPLGLLFGTVLFFAISTQQYGLQYTTAGKSAFITALYILFVPLIGRMFNKPVGSLQWIGAIIGTIGLYLLSIQSGFHMQFGDLITVVSSLFWSIHILLIDHFAKRLDGVRLSAIQFFVAGLLNLIVALFVEDVWGSNYIASIWPILFSGVVVVGVAYTFQILGQRTVNPATASLIMSFEAVVAVIAGMLLLNETMSTRELIGCAIMFGAIILSQQGAEDESIELSD